MNRLSKEKSPYLLQHADNPVDWYPWGAEAFEKAACENKPVFVSVGYATCHWCHVMEKESFEDTEVASQMNDAFVSVKVDREERPDIDGVLMSVCQMLSNGSCGWPLNVLMTADKKPFFATTYIPKRGRFGRAGMLELIPKIREAWNGRRPEIEKSAGEIALAVRNAQEVIQQKGEMDTEEMLKNGFGRVAENFDPVFGGFGNAPKFPSPHNLLFLLRRWKRTGNAKAFKMAEKTLRAMLKGGINDHIGFGFHRYSTDRRWLVPHFEKMLYDQALISVALTEMWQAGGDPVFRKGAERTLSYVMRDMTSPEGAFFSAEDADSEGEEGKFYVWSERDFSRVTGNGDESRIAAEAFGIAEGGNFTDGVSGKMPGTNIPHGAKDLPELAARFGMPEQQARLLLESARKKLFAEREKRPRPLKDDKILTDWNGLMIAAFAKAARAFVEEKYLHAANRAADFIMERMNGDGRLLHRFRQNEAAIDANLDDYAFMVWGLLELYEAGFETARLEAALSLNEKMTRLFSDSEKGGGFFFTRADADGLIVRKKEFHDGAVPCGNSVAVLNLLRISRITGDPAYEETALKTVRSFSLSVEKIPSSHTMLLAAMEFAAAETTETVIAANSRDDIKAITDALAESYEPNSTVLLKLPGDRAVDRIAPFAANCKPAGGKPAVYVCRGGVCGLPAEAGDFIASVRTEKKG